MSVIDLEKQYRDNIRDKIIKDTKNIDNVNAAIKLEKVIINIGVGRIASTRRSSASSKKTEEELVGDIVDMVKKISGQKPQIIISKKSISGFKLREGNVVGLKVTLRGKRMYDIVGRLIHIALPRTRDFRGILIKSVDKDGNLTIGIRDMTIFPELSSNIFSFGCEVSLITNIKDREQAMILYNEIGIPFVK